MEQQSLITVREDLLARSKKAMIIGILSAAIPPAVILLGYILFAVLIFTLGIGSGYLNDSGTVPIVLFASAGELLQAFLVAGILMTVLGRIAWKQARSVRKDAIDAGIRRPAASIVAHAFGIGSFVSGLICTVYSAAYLLCLAVFAIVFGIAQAA